MATDFPADKFKQYGTPFYYYDTDVLRKTVETASAEAGKHGFHLHYAVKANANPEILRIISSYGIGADCVSWNEIQRALDCGFSPGKIVFAGAGKSDYEIENALKAGILCINCESVQEIGVIDSIAGRLGIKADIALRINPYVDAHTHKHITTAIEDSKFGIPMNHINDAVAVLKESGNINMTGIHFHIGSQITRLQVFKSLCARINEISDQLARLGVALRIINVGGGLGIDYHNPETIPSFKEYFELFKELLKIYPGQEVHFEPGRSLVAQCGSLISRVLYIKNGDTSTFAVIDAGMNDLIRPALYQAYHKIENITSAGVRAFYNVVGPVCESADIFGKQVELPETARGDIIAIRSVGAYGESMASRYNLRDLAPSYFSDRL
ncbi:MAG TPA: diaminopimelate decarboxylase [Bacteroidales bacterium]|nr:diaminopimelate decarboxylase [Bacteroidales bacterium]HRR93844.1 diaminopimelate decarboxylase [Bacteroidales bacterium]HRT90118.1 diaminopimelate decarboxylase [Bacteroidales bacterium]